MPRFIVSQLDHDQIDAAFPLVRMAAPDIEPATWTRFVESLAARGGAMLGVFAGDSTLHGLAIYRIDDSLRGRCLAVDAIVTFELNRSAPARAALVDALQQLASQSGCATLALNLPARGYVDAGSEKAAAWLRDGFAFDAVVLSRPVDADSPAASML